MNLRPWLASAAWACLAGIAGQFFIAVALLGLFLLVFGALVSAILLPFLAFLPTDWQVMGGQWIALAAGTWIVLMVLSGGVARWAWRRCGAVVFAKADVPVDAAIAARPDAPAAKPLAWSPAKRWAVLVGLFASLCFYAVVPAWFWSGVAGWTPTVPGLRAPAAGTTV